MDICPECGNNLAMFGGNHTYGCEYREETDYSEIDLEELEHSPVVTFINGVAERAGLSVNLFIQSVVDENMDEDGNSSISNEDLARIVEVGVLSGISTTVQTLIEQGLLDQSVWFDYFDTHSDPDTFEW